MNPSVVSVMGVLLSRQVWRQIYERQVSYFRLIHLSKWSEAGRWQVVVCRLLLISAMLS